MMSLDPLTESGRGYPLLFQSGESWHDQPLHDRQHPHDLFDELSISIRRNLITIFRYLYFGYPGEPALGPPTFITGFRQWMIRTRRSVITGRIQRTSRSASPRPACSAQRESRGQHFHRPRAG